MTSAEALQFPPGKSKGLYEYINCLPMKGVSHSSHKGSVYCPMYVLVVTVINTID